MNTCIRLLRLSINKIQHMNYEVNNLEQDYLAMQISLLLQLNKMQENFFFLGFSAFIAITTYSNLIACTSLIAMSTF